MEKGKKITKGIVEITYFEYGMWDDDKPIKLDIENGFLSTKYGRVLKVKSYTPKTTGSLGTLEFYGKDDRGKFGLEAFSYDESRVSCEANEDDYIRNLEFYELEIKGLRKGSIINYNDSEHKVEDVSYSKENFEYVLKLSGKDNVEVSTFDIQKDDVLETPYTFDEKLEQVISDNTPMFTKGTDELKEAIKNFLKEEGILD